MINKKIIIFAFMGIIGFAFIVAIPIGVLSVNFSSYGTIKKSLSFEYLPDTPSAVERFVLNVDIGDIEIKYIDPPVDYFVRIDVDIEMAGPGLVGKSYSDYFNIIEGSTTESPINFSLKSKSDINEIELISLIKNISVIVSLRKDITFNISTSVIHGNVDIEVPFNVRINNLDVNILNGDILFDLKNCIIDGNITGIGNQSNIELRTLDIQLTSNSFWYIKNIEGLLKFNISQLSEMGANVTAIGELETEDAQCQVYYDDFSSNVGSIVTLNHWAEDFPTQCYRIGFDLESIISIPENGYRFTSFDFPTQNYFNISLIRNSLDRWRPYFWFLSSEPN